MRPTRHDGGKNSCSSPEEAERKLPSFSTTENAGNEGRCNAENSRKRPPPHNRFIPVVPRQEEFDMMMAKKQSPLPLLRPRPGRKYSDPEAERYAFQTRFEQDRSVTVKVPSATSCAASSGTVDEAAITSQHDLENIVTPQTPPPFPYSMNVARRKPIRLQMKVNPSSNPFSVDALSQINQPVHATAPVQRTEESLVTPGSSENSASYSTPERNVPDCQVDGIRSGQRSPLEQLGALQNDVEKESSG